MREPDQLPQSPPYAAYAEIRTALDTLAQRHLAGFVFPDTPTSLRVMGDIPGILEQVAKAEEREQRKPRGPRTVSAEMIFTALRSTPDPAALLRYDIAARLRERVREHPYDDTLMRHVTDDLGLDPGEARRLVYAIRQESGVPGGPVGPAARAVDAGKIQAAVDFVEALPAEALTGDAAELAAEVRARLAKAVRLRDAARTEADSDQAWLMLEDALRRAPDLSGAGDLLAGLAPRPPGEVRARLHVVAIGWQPSPSRAGDIAYEVYRNGVPFAEVTRPSASDERPPVNTPVTYAVAARRGQATSVPVTCPPLTYRPEPEDVAADRDRRGRHRSVARPRRGAARRRRARRQARPGGGIRVPRP